MKLLDRLVWKELWGPWVFGVGMFTALLVAGSYLDRMAGYIADGAAFSDVAALFLLLTPAMLVKTFAMAMLLGSLLAFGRLSGDSEIVVINAAGISIWRLLAPVITFALLVAGASFFMNEVYVPRAVTGAIDLTEKIVKAQVARQPGEEDKPFVKEITSKGKLKAVMGAREVDPDTGLLKDVVATSYGADGKPAWTMYADAVEYQGPKNWRVRGQGKLISRDFTSVITLQDGVWPADQIPTPTKTLKELLVVGRDNQYDALSMSELREKIARRKADADTNPEEIRDMEYGYYNKIGLPLASVVFGMLGTVLGVRRNRTSAGAGFSLSIAIIFGYVALSRFTNEWAKAGVVPPYVSSMLPLAIAALLAVVVAWRRNL